MRDIDEFEQKCMDIIEVIVSIDKKNTREDAIRIAKKNERQTYSQNK